MRKLTLLNLGLIALGAVTASILSGCGDKAPAGEAATGGAKATAGLTGSLSIDGSTTVFPIINQMGEDFGKANKDVKVTTNKSGTGSGMQKFGRGEIEIATASRPIAAKEIDALKKANIDFIEIPIAYDGVSVVVNPANTWLTSISADDLKKAWDQDSKVATWADIKAGLPADKINFYGPSSNHGTFEYFTEAINKKKGAIRKDVQSNQEYTAIVTSVAGDKNGIAYVGYNYYAENKDKIKIVPVDGGKGPVEPSEKTIADGTYAPLSRPLFLYVSKKAYDTKPEVKAFVEYALTDAGLAAVTDAKYVLLPKEAIDAVRKHVADGTIGSLFQGVKPGMTITEVLAKEAGKAK